MVGTTGLACLGKIAIAPSALEFSQYTATETFQGREEDGAGTEVRRI
ncbi:hypothetical protein IQ230_23250 [Gloeocapsopsis crepidinum LEGE 06123]|uniref:Uncharacterized protein n=1 Tax=Gloeocapsopsis crepidinum LEGE 06123 TaxID=588587 RepID=A0ABR9UY43_9CHRO|nr:hypothetical protein [Gloeocapsopsis crepidinum]MBE9193207.1 hypothetical protein [Gloeocapsopsis crepidinum LEGE 06123]